MMKKLVALFAAMCLCASLVSCGNGEEASDRKKIAKMFEGKGSITYLVQVSINPEFELYLDDAGTVCELICLNKDAKVAFAEIDVLARPYTYDTVMSALLEAAKRGGYLTDESTVAMTVVVRANGEMGDTIIADLEKTVQEYISAEQYTLQVLDGRTPEEPPQDGDDGNQGDSGAQNNVEEVRDANGKLVSRTEQHQTLEGLLAITEYFDANEKISKRVEERNGTVLGVWVYEYDANGKLVSRTEEHSTPEGTLTVTEYFDANEKLIKKVEERNGAVIAVSEYDANGKLVSRTEQHQTPEGLLTVTEYFGANEIKIKEEQVLNGTVISASEYDANGRKISYMQNAINPEGVRETRNSTFSYDENGNVTAEYTHISDGSYHEAYYYADGSAARLYVEQADGSYVDDRYDENGNLISRNRRVCYHWGAYSLWTDHLDGTREEYYYETDGSVWYNWFDADGNQHGPTRVQ